MSLKLSKEVSKKSKAYYRGKKEKEMLKDCIVK